MSAIIAWIAANWMTVATVLLGISEALHLVFPSSSGFGGFIGSIITWLKGLGVKDPAGN